jgi:hypothetical protein
MTANVVNQVAYLRTSREFPEEIHQLTVEVNKSYVDIANAVNNRTISIFPTNRPAITGESWFFNNQRQQTLRQFYPFTTTTAIPHGINFINISQFTRLYGQYTDGTNWYGLIAGSNVAIAGQISFYLTPTDIVFLVGGGAPAVTKGTVILEWLSST